MSWLAGQDPAGPGTSLCAKCAGLLVNECIAGDDNDGGVERAAPLPVESEHTAAIGMVEQADGTMAQDDAESTPVEEDTVATAVAASAEEPKDTISR
eukprot:3250603-Pleurochrysis_carterae.AAC.2